MLVHRLDEYLASVPLFRRLPAEECRRLAAVTRARRHPRGTLIVRQGDPGDALYVVRSGQVKVAVTGDDGHEVILQTLRQGAHFGELALIDGRPHAAHVVAIEPTVLLVLRRDDFYREVERQPRLTWALPEALSRRLREANERIRELVVLDVPGRVACLLLDRAVGDPPAVERAPTHETMARRIGAIRESVSRAMRELQDAGLIAVDRRTVRVLDAEGLARLRRPGRAPVHGTRAGPPATDETDAAATPGVAYVLPGMSTADDGATRS